MLAGVFDYIVSQGQEAKILNLSIQTPAQLLSRQKAVKIRVL